MNSKHFRIITILSLLLAVTLAVVSFFGAFIQGTYGRETASMEAQGMGQDLVDLFLVVPVLVISLFFLKRNSKVAFYVYGGTVFYTVYSFIIYCFGVHFNKLFLLYCLTLGLSLYAFILLIYAFNRIDVRNWFGKEVPSRLTGIYLLVVSILFYLLWLKDIVPAMINDSIPASVSDYNLLVNPVHVLDIAFALPGLIITAVLIINKHNLGYILAPICLVFMVILAISLAAMVIILRAKGISDEPSVAIIFIILAVISLILLFLFLNRITGKTRFTNKT